ncbi:MAG: hypothetical protein COV74_07060 [Candidatus Omnitrophica bacterium CG11_big_fil_rev_8_21_14_0_20_45_26]|uniref:Uncharacterized protein n=1 Tax=Candidatus Abzuiibacterium crystallinum TaxID=1974748 RepID=A0A2H0LNB1_9BACT|nr:MAG: hypothetical protein COV74_07060 [Candidatus Omnitrophica bacterium CG11_big_fil_rev_8_21_14_0_20_45_26]PIW63444.1 MAG: hypothetical protein COW12_10400 [Candidatus Omnitrophica bacterium CG12_big_fil_rev_8_21_14_0_65_45_16]
MNHKTRSHKIQQRRVSHQAGASGKHMKHTPYAENMPHLDGFYHVRRGVIQLEREKTPLDTDYQEDLPNIYTAL